MESEQRLDYLVSTDWLAGHLDDPRLRIFDCTGSVGTTDFVNHGREVHYLQHHIPGAAYLDVANPWGELADPNAALPYTWPSAERLAETIGRLGISASSRVVLYAGPNPDTPNSAAVGHAWSTRAWWLLHHAGVDVAILDGGWLKWTAEGRPVSAVAVEYEPTTFAVRPDVQRGMATKEAVLDAIRSGSATIVDALSPESYSGEVDSQYGTFGNRRGHIATAMNVYFADLVDGDSGCFHGADRLREAFRANGLPQQGAVITYCGAGIGATMTGFGLKLSGREDVAIYDASMMEWNADPNLPMTDPSAA
ncbi:sulfurtransferase [Mycolicibacterium palauense]|uniref:sulfurtransferase n=1 Tax=Mycolicibacterium palauense TaxID=2034511 RepID=UPI001FE64DE4|nr:rhodanese-like domain-containing protein [Mycolicibacterium palauense]